MTEVQTLAHLDPKAKYCLVADVGPLGSGLILIQSYGSVERVVSYSNKSPLDRKYSHILRGARISVGCQGGSVG